MQSLKFCERKMMYVASCLIEQCKPQNVVFIYRRIAKNVFYSRISCIIYMVTSTWIFHDLIGNNLQIFGLLSFLVIFLKWLQTSVVKMFGISLVFFCC